MPTVDVDRDTAHDLAQQELNKSIYGRPSLSERLGDWFNELLFRIVEKGSQVPGGWFTIAVLVTLAEDLPVGTRAPATPAAAPVMVDDADHGATGLEQVEFGTFGHQVRKAGRVNFIVGHEQIFPAGA